MYKDSFWSCLVGQCKPLRRKGKVSSFPVGLLFLLRNVSLFILNIFRNICRYDMSHFFIHCEAGNVMFDNDTKETQCHVPVVVFFHLTSLLITYIPGPWPARNILHREWGGLCLMPYVTCIHSYYYESIGDKHTSYFRECIVIERVIINERNCGK